MKRAPKPLPPPTMEERAKAAEAARQLRAVAADPSLAGEKIVAHLDFSRPRRGEWHTTWANLPGFAFIHGQGYVHALLPGWRYTKEEVQTEMIPDLEKLAETGERPTEATR